MTQEDKELLLKDICARLPYGVIIECGIDYDFKNDITDTCKLLSVNIDNELCGIQTLDKNRHVFNESLDTIKPYLRPMESMTSKEESEICKILGCGCINVEYAYFNWTVGGCCDTEEMNIDVETFGIVVEWLNKKMFDYRGLIEMGLALEAPKDMYNF